MALTDKLLINRSSFGEVILVPVTVADDRINPHIYEAQLADLKPMLGEAFYHDIVKRKAHPDYQLLLNGGEYDNAFGETVEFAGLKYCLCYYSLARFYTRQRATIVAAGVVKKITNDSEQLTDKDVTSNIKDFLSIAAAAWTDIVNYLNVKQSDFPLWKKNGDGTQVRRPSVKMDVIARR